MRLTRTAVQPLIRLALREDAASRDRTSRAVVPPAARIRARIVAKASGVLAGGPLAAWTFHTVDPSLRCAVRRREGARLFRGATILTVEGRARSIFAAERVALNFLGHLSGVATLTRAFVRRTRGTRATIYDTRKALPGLRLLEKYAVRAGGGQNHRFDLGDAILIKTNHLRAVSRQASAANPTIPTAVRHARRRAGKRLVEIEVTSPREYRAALRARPDAILLDNWRPADIRKAVALRVARRAPLLEASGGVTLANVRDVAKTGVDRIAVGQLTHSAPALDVSLEVVS